MRAYPRKADREEWLSYLLAEAERALAMRASWEEVKTARWGRPNKMSAIHHVLGRAIDMALSDATARDEIAAAMRTWHGPGAHMRMIYACMRVLLGASVRGQCSLFDPDLQPPDPHALAHSCISTSRHARNHHTLATLL